MNKSRLIMIGAVLAMAGIVLFGWMVGVQPRLAAAVAADQNATAVRAQNAALAAVIDGLKKDFERLDEFKKERDALRQAIPTGTDMPAFIDQVHALEVEHGVTLDSFTVTDGQSYVPPQATAPSGDAAAPTAAGAAVKPEDFTLMPIQLVVSGPYGNVLEFVQGLQAGTRLALVTNFSSSRSGSGPGDGVSATIGGFVYVLAGTQAGAGAP